MTTLTIHPSNQTLFSDISRMEGIMSPGDSNIYEDKVAPISYVYLGDDIIINYYLYLYLNKFDLAVENNCLLLKDRQVLSVNRAYHIIVKYGKVLDISHMGAGKSYVISVLSMMLGLPMVIISTKNVEASWEDIYGKEFTMMGELKFYSLDKISGSVKNVPTGKGEYLVKGKKVKKGKEVILEYVAGEKLLKLVRKGYLFVFDEIHRCKNINNFTEVVSCISATVDELSMNEGTKSKCIYASGTFSDKKDISPLLYAMNICDNPEMCGEGSDSRKSLKKFSKLNKELDEDKYNSIKKKYNKSDESDEKSYVRDLFCNNIMRYYCTYVSMKESSFPQMMNPEFRPDIKYTLVKLNTKNGFDNIIRNTAIKVISKNKNKKTMEIYNRINKVFNYCSIIPTIGSAIDKLMKYDNSKVIIYSNVVTYDKDKSVISFIGSHIKKKLAENGVEISVATMESKDSNRIEIINKFMNNPKCRCLVTSPDIGGTGISLDDKKGDKKMYIYINMNHKADVFLQTIHRAYRESTRSKPKIRIPICIGNDLNLPNKSKKSHTFNTLKEYEKAMNIKETTLEKAGKRPNGNLNYLVIKRVNEKLKNLKCFNTNTMIGDPTKIKYKFYPKATYPSEELYDIKKGNLPKEFEKILDNII